jgi:hypothetical protein
MGSMMLHDENVTGHGTDSEERARKHDPES